MERLSVLPWQVELWQRLVAQRDAMPHALLIHGRRGIGKRPFAEALSRWLLCEAPMPDQACGRCAGCALFAADNHPDLRRVMPAIDAAQRDAAGEDDDEAVLAEPASRKKGAKPSREIRIDQVRDLADFLFTTSHRGGRRVVLLAPAEALNAPAANALLKMLEEPPAATIFILVSDDLDAVLPTIRSRCILVTAPQPDLQQGLAWLREQQVDDAEARLAESGGAPCAVIVDDSAEDARQLAAPMREALLDLLAKGKRLTSAEIASAIPRDVPVGASIRLFQRWGWDLLAERLAQRVRYYPRQRPVLTTLARGVEPSRLLAWLESLNENQAASDHPLNARLVVEGALIGYLDAVRPRQ